MGHGPGELSDPKAIALGPDDRLYIANLERNVQVYRLEREGYVFERQIMLSVSANSLCVAGDKLVLQGTSFGDNRVIRVVDMQGRDLAIFGRVYGSTHELSNYMFSQGRVACDPAAGSSFTPRTGCWARCGLAARRSSGGELLLNLISVT